MAEEKVYVIDVDGNDNVKISEEVVNIVAGLGACEVDGVSSLYGGLTAANLPKAGASKISKALKVVADEEDNLTVRLAIIIKYGYEIPKICAAVQEKVKAAVENMTGLNVVAVDIRIAAVATE